MSDYEVAKSLGEVINRINRLRLKVNVDQKVWNLIDSIDCERHGDHCWVSDNGLVYGDDSIEKLYDELFDGVEIEFDLAKSERPSFDMRGNFSVVTRTSFVRRIGA